LKGAARVTLEGLGAQIIIPEMEIKDEKVIGVGIKGGRRLRGRRRRDGGEVKEGLEGKGGNAAPGRVRVPDLQPFCGSQASYPFAL